MNNCTYLVKEQIHKIPKEYHPYVRVVLYRNQSSTVWDKLVNESVAIELRLLGLSVAKVVLDRPVLYDYPIYETDLESHLKGPVWDGNLSQ